MSYESENGFYKEEVFQGQGIDWRKWCLNHGVASSLLKEQYRIERRFYRNGFSKYGEPEYGKIIWVDGLPLITARR
jgi:hypothetical protein